MFACGSSLVAGFPYTLSARMIPTKRLISFPAHAPLILEERLAEREAGQARGPATGTGPLVDPILRR
jgi:hypothetical protein